MKKITTTRVAKDFAESEWVVLEQTPETTLLFKPEIHSGGVRGHLVRFKKEKGLEWKDLRISDFDKIILGPKQKVEIDLSTETIKRLRDTLDQHSEIVALGIKNGKKEYVVAEKDKVVIVDNETKRAIFDSLLEKGYSDEFWGLLQESEPELATRLSVGHLYAEKIKNLEELRIRLEETHSETSGPDSWQKWIYAHDWLFGTNYVQTIEKARVSISGSMPDYLFLTADHSVDVLEIKLPNEEVIVADTSHPGSYKWCPKTNEAIGQVVMYLGQISRLQTELEREIKGVYGIEVSFVKPRAFVLIGKKDGWNKYKLEALRELNFALHGVEVLTYTDLLQRGAEIAQMYKKEVVQASKIQ